jgi:bacterioferritin-associated ferredoxin
VIVCSCRAVSDSTLRDAVAHGATSAEELSRSCDVGNRCKGCWPALERFIAENCGSGHGAPTAAPAPFGRAAAA